MSTVRNVRRVVVITITVKAVRPRVRLYRPVITPRVAQQPHVLVNHSVQVAHTVQVVYKTPVHLGMVQVRRVQMRRQIVI